MAHSPHRRHKGCALCRPHQWKGQGKARRSPWAVNRQLGRKRRWNRRVEGDE